MATDALLEEIVEMSECSNEKVSQDSWQTVVTNKKRNNNEDLSCNDSINKKPKHLTTNGVRLQNRFEPLRQNLETQQAETNESPPVKEATPPPIFIPNIQNVKLMEKYITDTIGTEEFSYKCMVDNTIKLMLQNSDCYRKMIHAFNQKNISFHTYQLKKDRAYRVVLKNMHHSADIDELKHSLDQMGHKVRNIINARHYQTKAPMHMFFIDLEPSNNNKEIFDIHYLLNAKINFEPPRVKKEIVQCKRCQQYGHTKTYCRRPYQCVKCGQMHDTSKCTKTNSTPAVCALCGGEHPANYKGCQVYKTIQKREFPPLRTKPNTAPSFDKQKTLAQSDDHTGPISTSLEKKPNSSQSNRQMPTRPNHLNNEHNYSYADATKSATDNTVELGLTQSIQQFFDKFEKLFFQQSQQIGSLLNLLTSLIAKLN